VANRVQQKAGWSAWLRVGLVLAGLLAGASAQAQINLGITLSQPVAAAAPAYPANSYTPGTSAAYTLVVTNSGATADNAPVISTSFPASVSITSGTCTANGTGSSCSVTPIGSGNLNRTLDDIGASGGTLTYVLNVNFASSLSADLTLNAQVASGDSTPVIRSVVTTSTVHRVSDASLVKNALQTDYTPGGTGTYTLVINNAGPSDVSGLTLTEAVPTGMALASWTCSSSPSGSCPAGSGAGSPPTSLNLPDGRTFTYTLTANYAASATANPIINTASVAVPGVVTDPDLSNNSDNASKARNPQSNLGVIFIPASPTGAPTLRYIPGSTGNTVTLRASNAGPTNSTAATLALNFPTEVSGVTWACNPLAACTPNAGSANISTAVTLAASSNVDIAITLDYASNALIADLDLVATITAVNETDSTSANNSATNRYQIDRRADITVVKDSGLTSVNPGAAFEYDIVVSNLGPSDVGNIAGENGIRLNDTFIPQLLGDVGQCTDPARPCWEYCPDDGGVVGNYTVANCPATVEVVRASGNISNRSFRLRAGSTSTLTAFVSLSGTASGSVSNTASVAIGDAAVTELNPTTGNSSTDTVTVVINTDISVDKTDGVTSAIPGAEHSYEVTVRNIGFVTANNVRVEDVLPLFPTPSAGFVPGSISYQCRAFDGACCNTNSTVCGSTSPTPPTVTNALSQAVDLPSQSRVVFTVTGRVDPRATGTLDNLATATLPVGIDESNTANNSDRDNDTVLTPQAQLSLDKTLAALTPTNGGPPFALRYQIDVGNAGPSRVAAATITDALESGNLNPASATWTCTRSGGGSCGSGSGALNLTLALAVDESVSILLDVNTILVPVGPVVNTARVNSAAGNAIDTLSTGLTGSADLSISKTDDLPQATPGTQTEYTITVANTAGDDVFGARVIDAFPTQLDNVSWSCVATTPVPGDLDARATAGASGTAGNALALSADGRHVYQVGSAINSLFVYRRVNVPGLTFGQVASIEAEVNGVNDAQDSGPSVTGMDRPIDVALSPDGAMVFVLSHAVTAGQTSAIAAFNRVTNPNDPNYGRLSFAGSVAEGIPATPRRLLVTAQNIYVSGSEAISIYRRDPVSGLPLHDISHTAGLPAAPGPMALSGRDALLFVASTSGNQLASLAINTSAGVTPIGRLTPSASLPDTDFGGATDLVIEPQSRHLYLAAGTAARVNVVRYTELGGLSKIVAYSQSDLTVPAGLGNPLLGSTRLALAPDGEHLILASRAQSALVQFRRDTVSGGLAFEALLALDRPIAGSHVGLSQADDVALTSDGRHVLVASADGSGVSRPLAVYARRAPDPLFAFLEVDRDGDAGNPGPVAGLQAPTDVAVSRDGHHVYAVSLADHALSVFKRDNTQGLGDDSAGGHLRFVQAHFDGQGGVAGLASANRVLVSPDGLSVYVSSEVGNSVAVFARNADQNSPDFGKLTWRAVLRDGVGGVDGLLGAHGMAMDSGSGYLYVAGSFEAAIAIFRRNGDSLSWIGQARSGSGGVTGLAGIRDLAVSGENAQLLGVGSVSNTVVAFNRNTGVGATAGMLTFVQARSLGAGERPVSISLPSGSNPMDNEHVYVAAQNGSKLFVLRRVIDPSSAAFGTLEPLFVYSNNAGGIVRMNGPRDLDVSADGKRVYVAAQFDHSVLIFDRDLNRSSANFGGLRLVDTRTSDVDGVAGLDSVYAVAVSADSRNVYAAGFGDAALASFAVGTGSSCSAGGGGDIDDEVTIGAGGTLVYRATATIRSDAQGPLVNTARVELPARFTDPDTSDNQSTDSTNLVAQADLSVSKTNSQVSVVAGQPVSYEVVVRNPGPSNVDVASVSDRFDLNPGFAPNSVTWTCVASGSGALDFVAATFDTTATPPDPDALRGVSGLSLVPDSDGAGPLGRYLAAASVLDSSLTVFERDPLDGRLLQRAVVRQGSTLNGSPIVALDGARHSVASGDGRFMYVASRVSDSISVFGLVNNGSGALRVNLIEVQQNRVGLDQALHLTLSPDGAFLYVAGANDGAIAVFARNATSGALTWIESEQDGINDPDDSGGTVAGLQNVEYVVVSPDGAHLYGLSGTSGSVARFDRNATTGRLSWRSVRNGNDFGLSLAGASSAVFDPSGEYLYLTAAAANRVAVLRRNLVPGANFGSLSLASSVTQGIGDTLGLLSPRRAVLSGDAAHLYVTGQAGGSVAWFVRDPADGALRFLGLRSNESSGVDGLGGATGIALDPDLDQLYVAGTLQHAVVQFARQSDSFCPPSGSGNASLNAVPVSIAAGGSVTFAISALVSSNLVGPLENIATVQAVADPNSLNNQATDTDAQSTVADLSISKSDGLAEFDGLDGAAAMTGSARHLYVAGSADNAIGVFRRNDDPGQADYGTVRYASVVRSGVAGVSGIAAVADVLLSQDGAHVYAVSPADNSIASFERDPATGALSFLEFDQNGVLGVSGIAGARALAQSPDGRHLYVAGSFSNAIATFARDADPGSVNFGRLTFRSIVQNGVSGVDGLGEPIALTVSPDGSHVIALGAAQDTLAVFTRNPNSGSSGFGNLTFSTRYVDGQGGISGLIGVQSLALDAAGEFLYVLGAEDGTVVQLARTAVSGVLTFVEFKQDGSAGVSGLAGARRLRLSADQAHLYVAGSGSNAIAHFAVQATDGTLDFAALMANNDPAPITGGQVIGLTGVSDVLLAPDGAHLYAVSAGDDALASFNREPTAGIAGGELDFRDALFDGLGGVAPGEAVTYLIRVDNAGPSDVAQARVIDAFPSEFASVTWTCTPSNGGQCAGSGSGNINTLVNLPVGGRVVFAATGVVGDSASGRLINTATVAALGAVDPNEPNNSATDDDTVLSPAMDLVARVSDGSTTAVPGGRVDYTVSIDNLGPTYATGAIVSDRIPAALIDVEWSCSALPVNGVLSSTQQLALPLERYRAIRISALGRYAYAVGDFAGLGAIAVYQRNPLSGELSVLEVYENGSDGFVGLVGATDLTLSNDERFLYVASAGSDAVTVFARDADTGLLEFLAQYQDGELGIEGLGGASRLLLSPNGAQLYAAGARDDAIAIFSVNATTGLLTQSGLVTQVQTGVDGLNGIADMALSTDALHLLVVAGDNRSLASFRRSPGNGALTFAAIVQNFQLPGNELLDPTALQVVGSQVLVAAAGGNRVARFNFSPAATSVFSLDLVIANGVNGVSGLTAPRDLLFEPDQSRLYVAAGNAIHIFSLQAETPESLGVVSAPTFPRLVGVANLVLSPDRKQLISGAIAAGGGIGVWARERGSRCPIVGVRQLDSHSVDIAPGGSLTYQIGGEIFANAAGSLVYDVEVQPAFVDQELNPIDNIASDTDQLIPAPDLSLSKSDGRADVVAGLGVRYALDLANAGVSDALSARLRDPAPRFPLNNAGLLAGSGSWTCSANLPLAFNGGVDASTVAALQGVTVMATSPDSARLYAVNPAQNALLVFPLDANGVPGTPIRIVDGQALGTATVSGLAGASSVTVTADGRHVLVTGAGANALVVLGYDLATNSHRFIQKLTSSVDNVTGLIGPVDVVATRDGLRVFVAAPGSESIAVFRRDAGSGLLTFVERVRDGLGTIVPDSNVIKGVRRLHASEDGANLYAVSTLSQAVSSFAINPVSSQLTYLGVQRHSVNASLTGARDLVASPNDEQFYALGSNAITLLARQDDGRLQFVAAHSTIPGLGQSAALSLDESGSRLYLADSAGAVHVFARNWNNGALDHRFRFAHAAPGMAAPAEVLYLASAERLFSSSPVPGGIAWLDELALSRCLTPAASEDAVTLDIDLGERGSGRVAFDAIVHPSARGILVNNATLLPADGTDPAPANNSASDSSTILVVSDLSIGKSAPVQAVAGTDITFQLNVNNAGPSNALGLRVLDVLHPALRNATWTCVAEGSSSCPASGSGNVDLLANLHVGDELVVSVVARIDSAFLGSLPNLATLVPEPGASDPSTADHGASSNTEVIAVADVSIAKSNGVNQVIAGVPTRYRIDVSNAGPSHATSVTISDPPPVGLAGIRWTCTASGGASCPAAGTDMLDFAASLPPGSSLAIDLDGDVPASAQGELTNVARASVNSPATDPNLLNNEAVDRDTILIRADLSLSLFDEFDPFDPAGSVELPYLAQVRNAGPSVARNVMVRLNFSPQATLTLPSQCVASGANAATCDLGEMQPGAEEVIALGLGGLPAAPATLNASGEVDGDDEDPLPANNVALQSTQLVTGGDVVVSIDNGQERLNAGQVTRYSILVRNVGSQTVDPVVVDVPLVAELINATWTCTASLGTSCLASGTGSVRDTMRLRRGESVLYQLTATVDPSLDPMQPHTASQTVVAGVPAGSDFNLSNNTDSDDDMVGFRIFNNGFESAGAARLAPQKLVELNAASCAPLPLSSRMLPPHDALAPVTVVQGRSKDGALLLQLDGVRHADRAWLQLSRPGTRGKIVSGWHPWSDASLRFDPSANGFGLGTLAATRDSTGDAGEATQWWVWRDALQPQAWEKLAMTGCVKAAPGGRE